MAALEQELFEEGLSRSVVAVEHFLYSRMAELALTRRTTTIKNRI
jgi:hypothetical protein